MLGLMMHKEPAFLAPLGPKTGASTLLRRTLLPHDPDSGEQVRNNLLRIRAVLQQSPNQSGRLSGRRLKGVRICLLASAS